MKETAFEGRLVQVMDVLESECIAAVKYVGAANWAERESSACQHVRRKIRSATCEIKHFLLSGAVEDTASAVEDTASAVEKLNKIEEVLQAYCHCDEPYGDDPEIGAPTAMSEIIAIVEGRGSPIEIDKRWWRAKGEEAVQSIGRMMIDGIREAEVEVREVVDRDDSGVTVVVLLVRYLTKSRGYEADRRKELPVGSMYKIGFGVLQPIDER